MERSEISMSVIEIFDKLEEFILSFPDVESVSNAKKNFSYKSPDMERRFISPEPLSNRIRVRIALALDKIANPEVPFEDCPREQWESQCYCYTVTDVDKIKPIIEQAYKDMPRKSHH